MNCERKPNLKVYATIMTYFHLEMVLYKNRGSESPPTECKRPESLCYDKDAFSFRIGITIRRGIFSVKTRFTGITRIKGLAYQNALCRGNRFVWEVF